MVFAAPEDEKKGLAVGRRFAADQRGAYANDPATAGTARSTTSSTPRVYWNCAGIGSTARGHRTEVECRCADWYYFDWLCGDHIFRAAHPRPRHDQLAQGQAAGTGQRHGGPASLTRWARNTVRSSIITTSSSITTTARAHDQPVPPHPELLQFGLGARARHQRLLGRWRGLDRGQGGAELAIPQEPAEQRLSNRARRSVRQHPQRQPDQRSRSDRDQHDDLDPGPHGHLRGQVVQWDDAIKSQISLAPQEYSFQATPPVTPDAQGFYPVAVPGVTRPV